MKRAVYIVAALTIVIAGWWFWHTPQFQSWWYERTKPDLPIPESISDLPTNKVLNANLETADQNTNVPTALPAEKNLAIPFTSQAPDANWDADHEEFCEEAAMLMVGRYFQGREFADTTDAENGLQQIKSWEVDNLGFYFDTTAEENAQILRGVYGLTVELLYDPSVAQIKTAVAAGHPVIVPSAGRELGNPNFKSPGPIYHNLVIRGYTDNGKFITNDPGTRKGEEYVYDEQVLMSAIHDWVPRGDRTTAANGDVATGARVVLVVSRPTNP